MPVSRNRRASAKRQTETRPPSGNAVAKECNVASVRRGPSLAELKHPLEPKKPLFELPWKLEETRRRIYLNLKPWEHVQLARHPLWTCSRRLPQVRSHGVSRTAQRPDLLGRRSMVGGFAKIGDRRGMVIGTRCRPEIALLPIGAYFPDSFRHVHMGPDEAIEAFKDLRAHWLIPMHYGTFKLSFEDMDEPPRWLNELAQRDGLSHHVRILEEGVPRFSETMSPASSS